MSENAIPADLMRIATELAQVSVLDRADRIARAILAERERNSELRRAATVYFERYCQDEAADDGVEHTGCSEQQHLDAKALAAAIRKPD